MTALIRCCFSAERCLISPQRLLQLFLIVRRFLCRGSSSSSSSGSFSSSSDGCLLRSIWFILFTVFTCLFQRVCDLISFQHGSPSLLEAKVCNFPFLFESCSVLLVFSKVQWLMIYYPIFTLIFERFPFGFFATSLRSFFFSNLQQKTVTKPDFYLIRHHQKSPRSDENQKRLIRGNTRTMYVVYKRG